MSTVTIAVDLAKNVFEIAVSNCAGTIKERKRLSRPQFEQFWGTRASCRVVMEACSTSHLWGRYLLARGFGVGFAAAVLRPALQATQQDRSLRLRGTARGRPLRRLPPRLGQDRGTAGAMTLHRVRSKCSAGGPLASTPCVACCASLPSPYPLAPSSS
jgi:transposase